jgi:hypothetical protein
MIKECKDIFVLRGGKGQMSYNDICFLNLLKCRVEIPKNDAKSLTGMN